MEEKAIKRNFYDTAHPQWSKLDLKKRLVFITMDESEAETTITALLLGHSLISGSLFTIK